MENCLSFKATRAVAKKIKKRKKKLVAKLCKHNKHYHSHKKVRDHVGNVKGSDRWFTVPFFSTDGKPDLVANTCVASINFSPQNPTPPWGFVLNLVD